MTRKPLVQVAGQLSELPAADSLSMATPALPVVVLTNAQITTLSGVITLSASNFPETLFVPAWTGGSPTIELPPVAAVVGRRLTVVVYDTGAPGSTPTIDASSPDTFNGVAGLTNIGTKGVGSVTTLLSDGVTWRVLEACTPGILEGYSYWDAFTDSGLPVIQGTPSTLAHLLDATGGDVQLTLPSAAIAAGKLQLFTRVDTLTTGATLKAAGGDLLNGSAGGSLALLPGDSVILFSDGVGWVIFAKYSTTSAVGSNTNKVAYTADFGALGTFISATVSAPWVTAQTVFTTGVMPGTGHDPEDVLLEQVRAEVANPVAGVGFDINVYAPDSTWGQYTIHIIGVN